MSKINFKKLCEVMMWERAKGEAMKIRLTAKTSKLRKSKPKIVDVVHASSLEDWAKKENLNHWKS